MIQEQGIGVEYSGERFLSGTVCYYYVGSRWAVKLEKCRVSVMVPASHSRTQQVATVGGEFSATLVS